MTPRSIKRLEDAKDACFRIGEFIDGISFDEFQNSDLLRSALERKLEIVGEALGQAAKEDESSVEAIPEIPRIVSLRNRLIHGYDAADPELVWDVVQTKIVPLRQRLETICADFD
jgi:uncharacterized protein with HEPN domain